MELFKIGFISIKLVDIIDILIISYVFYKLYKLMRGTIAFQIFIALLLIIGFSSRSNAEYAGHELALG